jgi:hypothetical protein
MAPASQDLSGTQIATLEAAMTSRQLEAAPDGGHYNCPLGVTATYRLMLTSDPGGSREIDEQICNGGLLSGALSGDVRGFLSDVDALLAPQ